MSFVVRVKVIHILMNILESYLVFSIMRKRLDLTFLNIV